MTHPNFVIGLLFAMMIVATGFVEKEPVSRIPQDGKKVPQDEGDDLDNIRNNQNGIYSHITTDDSVRHMVNHPAFKGFGRYLIPWDNSTSDYDRPLSHVGSLMPHHSHVDPNVVVAAINHMIDEVNDGKTIFYEFYTEREKQEDPTKASTGLFFFRGNPGAPFAIVCPGGGFAYVGSLHEGFPHAVELSKKRYNAFVLKYRTRSELIIFRIGESVLFSRTGKKIDGEAYRIQENILVRSPRNEDKIPIFCPGFPLAFVIAPLC